ncbi:MAG: hypothetical protein Q9167_000349 [Letrouitia subvulpina]
MALDTINNGPSPTQSQSPDDSGDPDANDMAEHSESIGKPNPRSQISNGQGKSASNAKDPLRPRRKKARRACYACQRAHLTCGDERPCQRCIKRGLQDACHDGVRKKAKYLHDAPNEALMPGVGAGGPPSNPIQYLTNLGRGQPLPPDAGFQGPSPNEIYAQQQGIPPTFTGYSPLGPQTQMTSSLPDNIMTSQSYRSQHSPIASQFTSGPNHQASPMQSMVSALQQDPQSTPAVMQPTFGGNVFDVNDAMQYNFDPASFNFGNHYGALEFGMLGHMSSGAAETPPTDSNLQLGQGNNAGYNTAGGPSAAFGSSPTNAQSYFYPHSQQLGEWGNDPQSSVKHGTVTAPFDQGGHNQDPNAIRGVKQEISNAVTIGAGSSAFTSPSDTSSTTQGVVSGFDESPSTTITYPSVLSRQGTQEYPSQQRPGSRISTPRQQSHGLPTHRTRDPSTIYESVKQPYSYTNGFHGLTAFLQKRFSPQKTLRIAKALASIRPSFISCTKTLKFEDLVFMEKCFQRTLWEYEDFINAYGTPTIVCRRTGEIAAVGKEFSILTGWRKDVLLGKEANLNVNTGGSSGNPSTAASSRGGFNTPRIADTAKPEAMDNSRQQPVFLAELLDDESAVEFYEDFARLAFGDSRGSVTTRCKLLKYKTKKDLSTTPDGREKLDHEVGARLKQHRLSRRGGAARLGEKDGKVECSYCWTVKRDVFDIPMLIVMNVRSPRSLS